MPRPPMSTLRTFLPPLAPLSALLFLLLPVPGIAAAPAAQASLLAPTPVLLPYESTPPAATHPSLYSFADAYRLAVSGRSIDGLRDGPRFSGAQARLRNVSQSSAEAASAPSFSVSAPHDGGRWPLLLAGLFACAWVAHRRLTSP